MATLALLWALRDFLIPLVTATVLAVLLWPTVLFVERLVRLRVLAVSLVMALSVTLSCGLALAVGTQLSGAAQRFPTVLRLAARDVAELSTTARAQAMRRTRAAMEELDRSVARATGAERAPTAAPLGNRQGSVVSTVFDWFGQAVASASRAAAGVALRCGIIALLTFFILCNGSALAAAVRKLCEAAAIVPHRCALLQKQMAQQVRLFAGLTMVTNAAIGVAVALGAAAIGVPDPVMWGVAAGVLHFVPYAGMAVLMGLAALEAYVAQSSLGAGLLAAGYVMVVGVVVGTAMTVWLQGRAARVDSALLFAGTLFWSILWGAWGLVLGPLLVVLGRLLLTEGQALAAVDTELPAGKVAQAAARLTGPAAAEPVLATGLPDV